MGVIVIAGTVPARPFAPTLLSPDNGAYADLGVSPTFQWQYNPGQAGGSLSMTNWVFERIINGGATQQFWDSDHLATFLNFGATTGTITTVSGNHVLSLPGANFPQNVTGTWITATAGTGSIAGGGCVATWIDATHIQLGTGTGAATNGTVSQVRAYQMGSWSTIPYYNDITPTYGTLTSLGGGIWQYTFSANAFVDGNSYQWTMLCQDANGIGSAAPYNLVTAQQIPVVTVNQPTGAQATSSPTVSWSTTFAPGASQVTWQVIVYSQAQYSAGGFTPGSGPSVYDSGVIGSGATSLNLASAYLYLPTGGTYRAYVQVVESHNLASAWTYSGFTTSYTAPSVNTPVATATTDSITGCPKIHISTTGTAMTGVAVIQRSDGAYVRGASPANPLTLVSGQVAVDDYEVTPSQTYTYTLQIIKTTSGVVTASALATSNGAFVTTTKWWEFDPTNPSTAFSAQIISWNPQVTEQSTAHLVLGQSTPNVVAANMGGLDGTATFETFDPTTYSNLQGMLTSQTTYFLMSPWGVSDTGYVRFGPQSGGASDGNGNKVKDSTLLPSTLSNMHRTTNVTWVAQARPPV